MEKLERARVWTVFVGGDGRRYQALPRRVARALNILNFKSNLTFIQYVLVGLALPAPSVHFR